MAKRLPTTYILYGYAVRESVRAKRLSIRVSRTAEVEVVAPCGCPKKRIAEFVQAKQKWIEKTVQKVDMERRLRPEESQGELPTKIVLRSLPQEWTVVYRNENRENVSLKSIDPYRLIVSGGINHVPTCHYVLQKWVRKQAQFYIPQWLRTVSQETSLSYSKVTIRRQKTLWGSCSSKGSINLNDKLLFLPFALARYVLIHELCHTVHMNHGPDFWALVEQKEPDYRKLDQDLNDAWHYVPDWLIT
ncbi:MAG: SprT family zinc-dependent metalloprotease [Cyanobacteria bacterium P01_F01_bin.150]